MSIRIIIALAFIVASSVSSAQSDSGPAPELEYAFEIRAP